MVRVREYQGTGDQVRIAYETVFGKPMTPATREVLKEAYTRIVSPARKEKVKGDDGKVKTITHAEVTEEIPETVRLNPEMTYVEALALLEARYGFEKTQELISAVPNNDLERDPEKRLSDEDLKAAITEFVKTL